MNNNPEPSGLRDSELREDRKTFSLIGLACLAAFGLELAVNLLVSYFFFRTHPEYADYSTVWPWLFTIVLMYGICMPLGMIILKKAGAARPAGAVKLGGKTFFAFLAVTFAAMYLGSVASNILNSLIYSASGRSSDLPLPGITNGVSALMYFLITVVLAPVMEELFFRKYLLGSMIRFGDRAALLMGALIFAIAHHSLAQMVYAFLGALVFGYIYLRSGKIGYTMIIHALVNLVCGFIPVLATSLLIDQEAFAEMQELMAQAGADPNAMAGSEGLAMKLFGLIYRMQPGLSVVVLNSLVIIGMCIAGVIVFATNRKKTELMPGTRRIGRENVGYVVFMSPGMLAYMAFGLFYLAMSFFIG